jgi:two-component sensor histidine kinase
LEALNRADQRLTNSAWKGTSLTDVVLSEVKPFGGRVNVEGSEVILTPRAAQNFGLAVHELATNASKYGAFSNPSGVVSISWTALRGEDGGRLIFRWAERGGPTVVAPDRRGFGTSLLTATLGAGQMEYLAEGFAYQISLPLTEIEVMNVALTLQET